MKSRADLYREALEHDRKTAKLLGTLMAAVDELRDAVLYYGRHHQMCAFWNPNGSTERNPCTCKFDELLKELDI